MRPLRVCGRISTGGLLQALDQRPAERDDSGQAGRPSSAQVLPYPSGQPPDSAADAFRSLSCPGWFGKPDPVAGPDVPGGDPETSLPLPGEGLQLLEGRSLVREDEAQPA